MNEPEIGAHLKKLSFRAWHRGFREADLILGLFADRHLVELDAAQLGDFERLLDVPDQDLYPWIIGAQPAPEDQACEVLERLRSFRHVVHAAIDPDRRGG
jgi:antitoxin CptB